jgi:hypothetical protein
MGTIFDDSRWHVTDEAVSPADGDSALDDILGELNVGNAHELLGIAASLIEMTDFTPDQAATWRARFAARRAELLGLPAPSADDLRHAA